MRICLITILRLGLRGGLLGLAGCVEPYLPPVLAAPTNYLVVDGFINGNGVTRIKLSRTASLAATTALPVERGARVFIADNAGRRIALAEKMAGNYQSDSLLLNPNQQYQLVITTAARAEYASDLIALKTTPPIEELKWRFADNQVQLLLSTSDARQQSRYYRWSLVETWQFNSAFESFFEYDKVQKALVARTTPIYTCWRTERLSAITQGSSAQLSQDRLTDFIYHTIPQRSERLPIRYSVLVNQYAETAAEFAYYELLRKNTEAVGTISDPLPTQLTGNVHRLANTAEPVLGFVGVHTVQQKRLFIDSKQLPPLNSWDYDTPYKPCRAYPVVGNPDWSLPFSLPTVIDSDGALLSSSTECVDCRLRGTNVKPSFW